MVLPLVDLDDIRASQLTTLLPPWLEYRFVDYVMPSFLTLMMWSRGLSTTKTQLHDLQQTVGGETLGRTYVERR